MKLLPMLPILLVVLVVGIHVDQQLDRYEAGVGDDVTVMLMLSNMGESALNVNVTPNVPKGVVTTSTGVEPVKLPPGATELVTYPVRGEVPGTYSIASRVVHTDEYGTPRRIECGDKNGRMLVVV